MSVQSPLPSASTFSKDARLFGIDFHPTSILEGKGARVLGDDGQWYLDFIASLGSLLLGHGHTEFCERVARQVSRGINYSMTDQLEAIVAEKLAMLLTSHVPGWGDMNLGIRFVLSGSDGCEAAIRLARRVTGRTFCLVSGYHGWHSMYTGLTPPAWGVVPDPCMGAFSFGDLAELSVAFATRPSQVAAVIIEQPPQEPPAGYWAGVRNLCDTHGALLIMDEVVTGFRLALGGAAEHYNVKPDVAVYAKAISNGVPFGAIVGDRTLFDAFDLPSPCFVSGTGLGNSLSLAACDAVLDIWNQAGVDHLWKVGQRLLDGFLGLGFDVMGQPPRFLVQFKTPAERAFFIVAMRDRGVLFNRPVLVTLAHTFADVDATIAAASEVKALMDKTDVVAEMAGKLPMVLFSNR